MSLLYMPSNSPAANKQQAITFTPVDHVVHALLHKHHNPGYRLRLSPESSRVSYIEIMHHRRATVQPFYFFGANSTWTIQGLDPAPSSAYHPGHNHPASNTRNLGLNSSQLKTSDDPGLDVKISGKTSLNLDLGGSQWLTDAGKDININNDDHDLDLSLSILFDLR